MSNFTHFRTTNTIQDVDKRRRYPSAAPGQPRCQAGELLRTGDQAEGSAHLIRIEEARHGGGRVLG